MRAILTALACAVWQAGLKPMPGPDVCAEKSACCCCGPAKCSCNCGPESDPPATPPTNQLCGCDAPGAAVVERARPPTERQRDLLLGGAPNPTLAPPVGDHLAAIRPTAHSPPPLLLPVDTVILLN